MTQPPEGPTADQTAAGVPTCYRHPDRETWIRCQRCDKPICPDCMRDAAVGFQCVDCVKEGARQTRQGLATYGGRRSGDPRLTSFVLIGINAAVWLAIVATGAARSRLTDLLALMPTGRCVSLGSPDSWYPSIENEQLCPIVTNGDGSWVPGVAEGAWWQLITSAFTHVEIWHIGMNMLALFILGPAAEHILGRARFLGVYLVSALAGSVMVLWFSDPNVATLGASGAIFGLLGALLVMFRKARRDTSWLMQNLVLAGVITLVGWQFISWQGHLGGLLGGGIAAAVVAYAPRGPRRSLVQWGSLAALTLLLLALAAVRVVALS